jgi:paraquat-inducible protein B
VLYFKESLRGLSVGAPVTFLGLPAGEVTSIGLEFDPAEANVRSRVVITFFPERLLMYANAKADASGSAAASPDEQKRRDLLRRLVEERGPLLRRLVEERGLRGQLRSGSLLTGQLYVSFDYYLNAPKAKVDLRPEEPELPVVPSTLVELEYKLTRVVDKIDKMPLEAIGNNIKKDLESLGQTLKAADKLITDADVHLVPGLKTAVEDLHSTLVAVERATNNANATLLESNAAAQEELRNALYEFTRAARSLRVLTDALEREPSSLIRGKTGPSGGK